MKVATAIIFGLCLCLNLTAQPHGPDTLWTRTWGGEADDYGYDVEALSDGGAVVVGTASFEEPWEDQAAVLLKIDEFGNTLWIRSYDSIGFWEPRAVGIAQDGGYILAGRSISAGFIVVKTDSEGYPTWTSQSPFLTALFLDACVVPLLNGGFVVVHSGGSGSFGDIFMLGLDAFGDTSWTRRYGGNGPDRIRSILQTPDNGFIMAGSRFPTSPGNGSLDAYLLKTDSVGILEWERIYAAPNDEWMSSLGVTTRGFILMGHIEDLITHRFYIYGMMVNNSGDTLWTRTYSELGEATSWDGVSVTEERFIAGCNKNGMTCLLEIGDDGEVHWFHQYDFGFAQQCFSVAIGGDGKINVAGFSMVGFNNPDISLTRTEPVLSIWPRSEQVVAPFSLYQNHPNPFNSTTTFSFVLSRSSPITLSIFNTLGQQVRDVDLGWLAPGEHRYLFDSGDLPTGVYFARFQAAETMRTRKVALIR